MNYVRNKTDKKEESGDEPQVEGTPLVMEYDDYLTFENAKVIVSKDESVVQGTGNKMRARKVTDTPVRVSVHNKDGSVEHYDVKVH